MAGVAVKCEPQLPPAANIAAVGEAEQKVEALAAVTPVWQK